MTRMLSYYRSNRKRNCFLSLLAMGFVSLLVLNDMSSMVTEPPQQPLKTILYHTPFFEHADWRFGIGQEPFRQCKVQNCYVTDNRSHFEHYNQFDAILFHVRDIRDFPKQSLRLPHQIYVMFSMETPLNADFPYRKFDDFFNWTMTYRRDSDIVAPYGWVARELGGKPPPDVAALRRKTKSVAWVVSNCGTHSQREHYVEELKKHIPVDVYGMCGDFKCKRKRSSSCKNDIEKDYRFHLSFENSFCRDYVTEKFWDAMNTSMIPVVLGAADYASIAPKKSYIEATKYSPKQLADFLRELEADEEEMLTYHQWKSSFRVVNNENLRMCRLCERLNDPTVSRQSYENLERWWVDGSECRKKGSFPWSKPDSIGTKITNAFKNVIESSFNVRIG